MINLIPTIIILTSFFYIFVASPEEYVFKIETAFPRCTSTDIRCNKKSLARVSPVAQMFVQNVDKIRCIWTHTTHCLKWYWCEIIICENHVCRCGETVYSNGHHVLSCLMSTGRIPRHVAFNNLLSQTLSVAGFPSLLEPPGILEMMTSVLMA